MRILFASNFFPPIVYGGYEQLCREVGLEFMARGHQVAVLTCKLRGSPDARTDGDLRVYRSLELEVVGGLRSSAYRMVFERRRHDRQNTAAVMGVLDEFRPDAVLVWGMWNVPRGVISTLENRGPERLCYYVCDYWPMLPNAYQQQLESPSRHRLARGVKRLAKLALVPLLYRHNHSSLAMKNVYCVSRATRDALVDAGAVPRTAEVIYGNARVEDFTVMHPRAAVEGGQVRFLCLGRLAPEKGVETALRAVAHMPLTSRARIHLDVVGSGQPEYRHHLTRLAHELHVTEVVDFVPGVPRAGVPHVLAEHDVLVFPSEWQEPFARSVLEAMAAGLSVIASNTGGTREVIADDETGLLFPAGDAEALARSMLRLVDEPVTRERLGRAGRRLVEEHFTFEQTVDELEATLK